MSKIRLYKNLDYAQPIQFANLAAVEAWVRQHAGAISTAADGLAYFAEQPDGEWLPVFSLVRIESDGTWEITTWETSATESGQLPFDTDEDCVLGFMEMLELALAEVSE